MTFKKKKTKTLAAQLDAFLKTTKQKKKALKLRVTHLLMAVIYNFMC